MTGHPGAPAASRPNVVLMHSHDTGRMVSPYGHPAPTPRLQALAEQGVSYRQAHSAAPTCSPSRAALLTGQSAHQAGVLGLAHRGFGLRDPSEHLVQTLHRAGYVSALVGVSHVAGEQPEGAVLGYTEELELGPERTDRLAPAVAEQAVRYLGRRHEAPFFLSVGFVETHTVPETGHTFGHPPLDDRWLTPPAPLPDTPTTRRDLAGFHAAAHALDTAVGRVLDAVDRHGLADRTLVVVTTDHGPALPGMKCTLTDRGTGVMLIVRGPGGFEGGLVLDQLVSQTDLFPTVCELAGIDVPGWVTGRSLLPTLQGEAVHDAVFAEINHHVEPEPARSVRTERWRYVCRFTERPVRVLANVDETPSRSLLVEHGWAGAGLPEEELYDLLLDPHEGHDLARSAEHGDVRRELATRLTAWMRQTGDPLLADPPGPVGPVGARPRTPVVTALMSARAWQLQFDQPRRRRLDGLADTTDPVWVSSLDCTALADQLGHVEVLLTGWGAPALDEQLLARLPRLHTVLHAGGTVRPLVSDALWRRGVQVSSGADLNARPVAEYTLAAVLMAGKKAPFLAADARHHREDWAFRSRRGRLSNLGQTIGVVGYSRIGRRVVDLLQQLDEATVLVADPYADAAEVDAAGASLVPLAAMLPRLDVLSLHAPALPSTRHLIGAAELAALPEHATLVNTARGSLVDTAALERECVSGRLQAILDVTAPEPLPASSVLYDLPNVMLTPHLAGSEGDEARRMADGALDELERLGRGEPLARPITPDDLLVGA